MDNVRPITLGPLSHVDVLPILDHVTMLATGGDTVQPMPPLANLIGECGGHLRLFEALIQAMCWATCTDTDKTITDWKSNFKRFIHSQPRLCFPFCIFASSHLVAGYL